MKYFEKNIAFLLFTVLLCVANAFSLPGDLDTTFNGTGKARVELGGSSSGANSAAIQADGKLILVGGEYGFAISRYNTDGSKDVSFGILGDANLLTTVPNPQRSHADSVRIQTDGKILVAGTRCVNSCTFAVVRVNDDGSLDPTFGSNGVVSTPFSISGQTIINAYVNKMILQTDGKIVVVGRFGANTVNGGAAVRYNTDGSLDTTFATSGIRLDAGNQQENFQDVAIQPDGKIVVVGTKCCVLHTTETGSAVNTAGIIRRFNANGSNDTTFASNGFQQIVSFEYDENYSISAVSLVNSFGQTDKIVYAFKISESTFINGSFLRQVNNNGSFDTSFFAGLSGFEFVSTILVSNVPTQSLSRILVAGTNSNGGFRATRRRLDGTTDTAFGVNGFVQTDFAGFGSASSMVTRSGTIFIAGDDDSFDFAAAKYDSNGLPDTAFGIDGKIVDDAGLGRSVANSIISDPNRQTVVAGSAGSSGTIIRFNSDGSLDFAFGVNGRFTLPRYIDGIFRTAQFKQVIRQPDGKIVAVAAANGFETNYSVVVRLNSDGTPDTSFSGDGFEVIVNSTASRLALDSLALQSDGKIVLAGEIFASAAEADFVVYRLNSNGTIDLNFDIDGKVVTDFGFTKETARSVEIQTDNKIIATGSVDGRFAAVRYNPDGSLDTTFSFDGKVVVTIGIPDTGTLTPTGGNASALQSDGKIIIAGAASNGADNDFALVRFNADGTLDNSFGSSGTVVTQTGEGQASANDIAIQTDGKLIVVGSSSDGDLGSSSEDFAIVRYNADGTLDSSFADPAPKAYGNGGIVLVDFVLGADKANSVTLDSIGRAVVAGNSGNPAQFSVARILGNIAPTAANVSVSGRVLTPEGRGLMNAFVTFTDSQGQVKFARSNTFGYFRIEEIEAGQTYVISVQSKRYQFAPQILEVYDQIDKLYITATSENGEV